MAKQGPALVPSGVSLSRAQRGEAMDQGSGVVAFSEDGAGGYAARYEDCVLAWQVTPAADLPGYYLARLELRTPVAAFAAKGWRWLRLHGLPLPVGTVAMLANGYNGWSESPLMAADSILYGESNPAQQPFGDHDFYIYAQRPGHGHSWSFSYAQVAGREGGERGAAAGDWGNAWFGSLRDDKLLSVVEFDLSAGTYQLGLDLGGAAATLASVAPVLGAWLLPGREDGELLPLTTVARAWGELLRSASELKGQEDEAAAWELPVRGYTSWYYRYRDIDEAWLRQNLAALGQRPGWSVFQVDDGYQEKVGDWLRLSAGFPQGLAPFFREVREQGMLPGIWCAPFVALEHSEVFREHPEWFLRDEAGAGVLCGDFPHWGGKFYALDLELATVQAHLESVLTVMVRDWGAAFLKADFLYAAGKVPAAGLSRAERASRAHRFLYNWCQRHNVRLLSCGAAIASSYHACDFARVGPDVQPSWEDPNLLAHHSREKCSTRASVLNALTRYPLDGAVFRSDPDVFILRDPGNQLTAAQRTTLATVNGLFGSLVFCSDLLSEYSTTAMEMLRRIEDVRQHIGGEHGIQRLGLTWDEADGKAPQGLRVDTSAGVFVLRFGEEPSFEAALQAQPVD